MVDNNLKGSPTPVGVDNPATLMKAFQEAGNQTLSVIRNAATHPNQNKILRTWGINEAAKMIGITAPTLRKHEAENGLLGKPSYDENSRRVYTLEKINQYREILGTRFKRPEDSSPIIASITNFKGGCAKTTTTVHLAQRCALNGIRTLLIDFDPQGTSTFICGGIIPDLEIDYDDTIGAALLEDPQDIKRILRKTPFDGLDLIPANLALQDTELGLPNSNVNNLEKLGSPAFRLSKALDVIKDNYDVILIDCGPNLGILTINAITASNAMLVPIPPNMLDYASFIMLSRTLQSLFESIDINLEFFRIMLTKHNNSKESKYVADLMRKLYGGYVLENYMCDTIEIIKATNDLGTVYEVTRPRGSREAYNRAITHLENTNREIISLFEQIWENQASSISSLENEVNVA